MSTISIHIMILTTVMLYTNNKLKFNLGMVAITKSDNNLVYYEIVFCVFMMKMLE